MFRHCLTFPLALAVLAFAQSAHAFFDPPWVTPSNPVAGETVSVNIHGGICDAIAGRPGYPQITRMGNAIRIVEFGLHYEQGDELCVFDTGTLVDQIGTFPAGAYTLTVDLIYRALHHGCTADRFIARTGG